jgi:hypothetical protein
MSTEHWWYDTDMGKPKHSERPSVHHKPHMDWPGNEPGLHAKKIATNRLSSSTPLSEGED